MDSNCFKLLYEKIEDIVGKENFLSEEFLELLEISYVHKKLKIINNMHKHSTGSFISGEIYLAIILRLMTGASYLDLGLLYVCGYSSIYRIFHYVIENWICNDKIVKIECYENLTNIESMKKAAKEFAKNGRNEGIFGGIISVLDDISFDMLCLCT